MAGYGEDFGRGGERAASYGGGDRMAYGGMRSDGYGSQWRDFPGEEGWLGGGYNRGYRGEHGPHGRIGGPGRTGGPRAYQEHEAYEGMPSGTPTYGGDYRVGGGTGYGGGYGGRGQAYGGFRGGYGQPGGGTAAGGSIGGYGPAPRRVGERGGWSRAPSRSRTRASDVMTADPEAVTPDAKLSDVARRMRDLDVGIIPVVDSQENRRLRGVVTDRDIAVRAVAEGRGGDATAADCMTTEVETCNKNDGIDRVLQVMRREQVRRVPITDREGRLVGIIAQADLEVDYAGDRPRRERKVQNTVEAISQPAAPERRAGGAAGKAKPARAKAGKAKSSQAGAKAGSKPGAKAGKAGSAKAGAAKAGKAGKAGGAEAGARQQPGTSGAGAAAGAESAPQGSEGEARQG